MPVFKVKVKWGKETFKDIEANTDEDPLVFKAQLFALTGVLPDRQKIVIKGTNLKDWSAVTIKDGTPILLMGSKEEDLPVEPAVKTVFMEDLSENELATALELPVGLTNLGNTCYMNATVQCLKSVPELRDALTRFSGDVELSGNGEVSEAITAALRDLYAAMDRGGQEVLPLVLLRVLHVAFPRFAEKGQQGGFQQQDANECWTEVVRMLQQRLPARQSEVLVSRFNSIIDQYFGGTFQWTMKCAEADESPSTGEEQFLQLSCFISPEVKYMISGLKSKLQEQITKSSPSLGRDAVYSKQSQISRLPAYLTVQFVRFFYKERGAINAKILKDVKFPLDLDVLELCTPELQTRLLPARDKFKEQEDKMVEESLKSGQKKDEKKKETKAEPYWFPDDIGSNNSGYYTLQAVLTHKGRSSSSGHYVAWVKHTESTWLKYDDDQVSPVTEEDVLKLSGGGDWHCAYVLLYGPRILRIPSEESFN